MSDELEVDAKKSLCWTCKHGLCLQETESQTMLHEPLPRPPQQSATADIFEQFEEKEKPEQEDDGGPIVEHVTLRRIQAICFWLPANIQNTHPIRVSEVTQCNRHEKRQS